LHVYLATTKISYISNGKYIEANAQALAALRQSLSKDHLFMIFHCDFAFRMWNTLSSLKEQHSNNVEREPMVDEFEQTCNMIQGNDSLKVTSKSHLDNCATSSNDHDSIMDAHGLNEELSMFYENLLSKYKA